MIPVAGLLATLFVTPVTVGPGARLLLLLPLAAGVSIVYKTIRCENIRELPVAGLVLWATIVFGMLAVGLVLLVAYRLLL